MELYKIIDIHNKNKKLIGQALCAEEDFEDLNSVAWSKYKGYISSSRGKMHTVVMNNHGIQIPDGYVVHHKNHIRHDNRVINLELQTVIGNGQSRLKNKKSSSTYYGVRKNQNKYEASVQINYILYNLGFFEKEVDAAEAYDRFVSQKGSNHEMNKPELRDQYKSEPLIYPKTKTPSTGYRGVRKRGVKFEAYIQINGKQQSKTFLSVTDAAKQYDKFVIKNKLNRKLNFPDDHLNYTPFQKIKTKIIKKYKDRTIQISIKSRPNAILIIDRSDYDKIKYHNITVDENEYPNLYIKRKSYCLSRFIMDITDPKIYVDHKDSDPFNNSRKNLRISNAQKNATNTKKRLNTTSKYYNVCYNKREDKWITSIFHKYKRILHGRYNNEEYAARRRDLYVLAEKDSHRKMNFNDWDKKTIRKWNKTLKLI